MDFKYLLTSMDGRIGRQTWWIGTLVMVGVSLVLYFIIGAILGTGFTSLDPAQMMEPGFMESYMRKASIAQLIMLAVLAYPVTALMAKRLNDRDRPSWLKWVFWAPTVLATVLGLLGMGYAAVDMGNGVMMPAPTALMTIVGLLSMVVGLWSLVELGILRGTVGPNRHGPDPVSG